MAKRDRYHDELHALAAGLAQPAASPSQGADTATAFAGRPDGALDIENLIHELQSKLSDAADDAEAIATAHPFAVMASAFLLGIVVGRLTGRS